jgi:hypothetical protein
MPSIRIHGTNLSDLDELDFEEIDELSDDRRQKADLKTNPDARARSAELQASRRSDRRKSALRGGARR